jgi:two-component system, OmpR family, response regulator
MRILVVEDEISVAKDVALALSNQGFVAKLSHDGEDAWFLGSTEQFAAIVLDLGLPRLDGLSVLKRWRKEGVITPVIVLSARGTWAERVEGIDAGADDYLPKPFEMEELLARLRAVTRRGNGLASSVIEDGDLKIDVRSNTTFKAGVMVNLTPLEFRLLHHLLSNKAKCMTKEELAEQIYDFNHERDINAIEAIVSRLRRKLGSEVIESKRGFGYRIRSAGSEDLVAS